MGTYKDKKGYKRHSSLISRQKAYEQIYLKNRDKYTLPFSEYVVHHKNRKKGDDRITNLEILTPEEHDAIHMDDSIVSSSEYGGDWIYKYTDKIGTPSSGSDRNWVNAIAVAVLGSIFFLAPIFFLFLIYPKPMPMLELVAILISLVLAFFVYKVWSE